jgi:hypothetical protein
MAAVKRSRKDGKGDMEDWESVGLKGVEKDEVKGGGGRVVGDREKWG